MSKILLVIAVAFLTLTGAFAIKSTRITPKTKIINNNEILACSSDSDCISVRADSCGCTAGGKATSINKNYQDQWEKDHPGKICPAVMSGHWTCLKVTPRCISNECKLVKRD